VDKVCFQHNTGPLLTLAATLNAVSFPGLMLLKDTELQLILNQSSVMGPKEKQEAKIIFCLNGLAHLKVT